MLMLVFVCYCNYEWDHFRSFSSYALSLMILMGNIIWLLFRLLNRGIILWLMTYKRAFICFCLARRLFGHLSAAENCTF